LLKERNKSNDIKLDKSLNNFENFEESKTKSLENTKIEDIESNFTSSKEN